MARLEPKDQGLLSRTNAAGEKVRYVRLWHEGKERRFGSFPTKTKAREFYENVKRDQREGRFFPEQFQRSTIETIETLLTEHLLATTGKRVVKGEHEFAHWWGQWFKGQPPRPPTHRD